MEGPTRASLAVMIAVLVLAGCGTDYVAHYTKPAPTQTVVIHRSPTVVPPSSSPSATQTFTPTSTPPATSTETPRSTFTSLPTFSPSLSPTTIPTQTAQPTPTEVLGPALVEIGTDYRLRFEVAARELTLWRGGTLLVTFPADALQLGRADLVDDSFNYDPYLLYNEDSLYQPPAGFRWTSPVSATISDIDSSSFTVDLDYGGKAHAHLYIERWRDGFELRLVPQPDVSVAYMRLRPQVDPEEAFYGLGEYFDDVNHRGKLRAMQLEADNSIESIYNEAHVPIPFLIGTRGWGLFVESYLPGVFDVARLQPDRVEAAFGTGTASADGLTFLLFGAGHPLDLTKHYYERSGYPKLPAQWALGPWIWRNENDDQAQFERDINAVRDLDLATTGAWIDRPYATGVNTFDFKASQFPDPGHMIDLAHRLGLRLAVWHTPYLDRNDPSTKTLREEAAQGLFYPVRSSLLLNRWGRPIDFTKPAAFDWWQNLIHRYTDIGIEGFKLDYGEDIVVGLGTARNVWQFADGSDERTMHAKYQLLYHKVYADTLPKTGGFLLCRHATFGDQQNGPIIWPGDLDASFAKHRELVSTPDGDSYVAVGGLPASMIAGIGLGPSGFPFYGSDTGGYRHAPPDKELFTRWFQQTALSSVMQIGTNTSDVAWEPTPKNGFDDEMLGWYRIYTRLHLRLFPYEWTYAQKIARDGRPIQRPLGLTYPELGEHPWDEYLFGDNLLVAPVVERGQRERQVLFPPGDWIDWWTGEIFHGPATVMVAAPLEKLPLYHRSGSAVPLLRPTIDAIAATTEPDRVDSYATTPGILYVRLTLDAEPFTVFDGTRISTTLVSETAPLYESTIRIEPGSEFQYGAVFEIPNVDPLSIFRGDVELPRADSVQDLEEMEEGWALDSLLYIKVASGEQQVSVAVEKNLLHPSKLSKP